MTYMQKFVVATCLAVLAYLFVPHSAKAVATLFLGMACGYYKAMSDYYD